MPASNLRIFQYQDVIDTAGISPTVEITSPPNGTQIVYGSTLTVTASAVDDVAVAQVNFLVNGQPVLTTTAAPYQPDKGDQGPGAAYNAAAKFYTVFSGDTAVDHDTRISHIGYDRKHTTAKDSNTWFPLPLMREFAKQGRFTLAKRFHGAPTNRSQRVTLETDAPEILARCRQDQVDAALLVPT